jgi:hypothetical protein
MVTRKAMSVELKVVSVAKNKVMLRLAVVRERDDRMRPTTDIDMHNSNSFCVEIFVMIMVRRIDPLMLAAVFNEEVGVFGLAQTSCSAVIRYDSTEAVVTRRIGNS